MNLDVSTNDSSKVLNEKSILNGSYLGYFTEDNNC